MAQIQMIRLKPHVVVRVERDDYAILYDPDTGEFVAISPSAVSICEKLDGKHSFEEIMSGLDSEFEGIPAEAETQIQTFFDRLVEKQFAERI